MLAVQDHTIYKSNKFPCTFSDCGQNFSRQAVLRRDERSVHERALLVCPGKCRVGDARLDNLRAHIQRHKNPNKALVPPFRCPIVICKETFQHRILLAKHVEVVHEETIPYMCAECLVPYKDRDSYQEHACSSQSQSTEAPQGDFDGSLMKGKCIPELLWGEKPKMLISLRR